MRVTLIKKKYQVSPVSDQSIPAIYPPPTFLVVRPIKKKLCRTEVTYGGYKK